MYRVVTLFASVLLAAAACISVVAQQPSPAPTPTPSIDSEDVVKITTKLVQVDVVVTDKNGAQVTGLTPADFELLQDGKPQNITGFTYVSGAPAEVSAPVGAGKMAPVTSPAGPRPKSEPPGRVIAFVVDDGACGASMWGINSAKSALTKFVKEQMQPTDLVAIYRTRAGSSTFQQFTSDREALLRSAGKIRWYPSQSGCGGTGDGAFNEAARAYGIGLNSTTEPAEEQKRREYLEDSIRDRQVVGTLGVIRYVVRGLAQSPGRKMVMLMSDGLAFRTRSNQLLDAREALRDVTDAANRAGVVVNSLYLQGAQVPGMIEARDDVVGIEDNLNAAGKIANSRLADSKRGEDGLATLAYETGGDFYQGPASLEQPIGRILKRETGYYLLAYEPAQGTFRSKKFNKIEVKVKRPDINVAYRSGFVGVPDDTAKPKRKSESSELYEAIAAPLPRAGLSVDLSAYFVNTAAGGNVVRATFHIGGNELTFVDDGAGQKRVDLDVVAVTMNDKNAVVDDFNRTHKLKFPDSVVGQIKAQGLVYSADVPVKKDGVYTFRVAVRDANGRTLGSASEIVTVPDLKRSPITLSGLTLTGVDKNGKFTVPTAPTAETAVSLPLSTDVPAIRRFRAGAVVAYLYSIYNAKLDASGRPRLTVKVDLYRDGKPVAEGPPAPAELQTQTDWARINDFGYLQLFPTLEPGDYSLRVTITDTLETGKSATASQWIDFEIDGR